MRSFYQYAVLAMLPAFVMADTIPTAFKPAPTRPPTEANIIIEDQETLDTCDIEQICVQGRIANNGPKPAANVQLKIEIGGTKNTKPRKILFQKLDITTMQSGDRQEFYVTINRKIPIKDAKGEEKILEVGKFNFKIVPVWTAYKPAAAKAGKSPKQKPTSKKISSIVAPASRKPGPIKKSKKMDPG